MTHNVLSPDLTVRDLNGWAKMQSGRLCLALGSDAGSHPALVLAQAVKLAEEVGELQAEVLGRAGYQRATKDQCFTAESMSSELADVMIYVAILASSYDIDLGKVLIKCFGWSTRRAPRTARYADGHGPPARPTPQRGRRSPLPDRDIGPGPGDHRRGGQRQDRYQLVADPAAVPRIDHGAQLFEQVTAAGLGRPRLGV